ncbi:hypothetical protein FLONG3_8658 [Fusarium longipes]|uniref:G domain-containing protein n=1 Tax=Fusarium longipes TaxID=694270 RepID=A0A395S3R2_9HYPO|nr:hypothetical protein FLONG3_8658 [Fusarium longipes]
MAEILKPALGQEVAIGSLCDARRGQFHARNISSSSLIERNVTCFPCPVEKQHQVIQSMGATHEARCNAMGIDSNLVVSVLCGLSVPQGSGVFLKDGTSEDNILYGVVRYIYTTSGERIDYRQPHIRDMLNEVVTPTPDPISTHVVVVVDYGLQSIITMKYSIKDPGDMTNIQSIFLRDLEQVCNIAKTLPSLDFSDNTVNRALALEYELQLYTDVQKEYDIHMQSLALLCAFVQNGPRQIGADVGLKGYPIAYTLLPLPMINQSLLSCSSVPNSPQKCVAQSDMRLVCRLFDRYNLCKARLDDYKLFIQGKKQYVPLEHVDEINEAVLRISDARTKLEAELRKGLLTVSREIFDGNYIQDLYNTVGSNPEDISMIAIQQSNKINFITEAVGHGASYIGFNGLSLQDVKLPHDSPTPHTFKFNNAVLKASAPWKEQQDFFMDFLWNPGRRCQVYIVDCDAPLVRKQLDYARLSKMERNSPTTERQDQIDYSSEGDSWSDSWSEREQPTIKLGPQAYHRSCITRYSLSALDKFTKQAPTELYLVKIPCPGIRCDSQRDLEWTCGDCYTPIESCSTDDYIYCGCGRVSYNRWHFRCNSDSHGHHFDRYASHDLYMLLQRSKRPHYRNILVLGETGVGKSTFINAFHDYLKFHSFDEARRNSKRKLEYVIPCQFSITTQSHDDPLEYDNRVIRVGSREDERDGISGESATQKTLTYTMTLKNVTYRLFDTPGIGDTRGPEKDKENLRGIMERLGEHEELHAILILLKTNETRLTATFQFCFEELLTIIQRDAVPNIVFGFTHTMDSNYRPGDCYSILKRTLKEYSNVKFDLDLQTSYSFDAESFRYLATLYRGFAGGDERKARESWDRSKADALRFLQHVDSLKPHNLEQTLSMEGVRGAVRQLMVPMVRVSQAIKENIELLDENLKDLQDTRLTGDKLRKRLHLQRIEFTAKKLGKPCTVCTHSKCCDVKENPNDELATDYKSICHRDCKLPGVSEDCVGHPGLIDCRAFKKSKSKCSNERCGHHWQEHMHILYELKQRKVQVKDTEVERRLKANTDDITVRQEGIRNVQKLQVQYEDERDQLRTAMVRFVAYLKRDAITLINDKTEDYYNELIKNEENKIQRGKDGRMNVDVNIKRLKGLEQDRDAYLELTETIKRNMMAPRSSSDKPLIEEGVKTLIQDLYSLPHFGKDLKKMKSDIVSSHDTIGRRRSHRRVKSRERKDVTFSQGVDERDESSRRRETEAGSRRGSTRESWPRLAFWRS